MSSQNNNTRPGLFTTPNNVTPTPISASPIRIANRRPGVPPRTSTHGINPRIPRSN